MVSEVDAFSWLMDGSVRFHISKPPQIRIWPLSGHSNYHILTSPVKQVRFTRKTFPSFMKTFFPSSGARTASTQKHVKSTGSLETAVARQNRFVNVQRFFVATKHADGRVL